MQSNPSRSFRVMPTPGGEASIWAAVQTLRLAVMRDAMQPDVRLFAQKLVASCAPADVACRIARVYAYVKTHLSFVPDPRHVEALGTAAYHLGLIRERGESYGDCDDASLLIGALATAVGVPVRFGVGSFRPDRKLHHIWPEMLSPRGWFQADPFRAERMNQKTPTRVIYVSV